MRNLQSTVLVLVAIVNLSEHGHVFIRLLISVQTSEFFNPHSVELYTYSSSITTWCLFTNIHQYYSLDEFLSRKLSEFLIILEELFPFLEVIEIRILAYEREQRNQID